jgi:hypothetical protein
VDIVIFRKLPNAMYPPQNSSELYIYILSLRCRMQAGLKAQSASYSINTEESFQGGKTAGALSWLLTSKWRRILRKATGIPQQH